MTGHFYNNREFWMWTKDKICAIMSIDHLLFQTLMVTVWGEWPSGLSFAIRIERFLVQNPLGAWPGLGTQSRYEAPGDLHVEFVQMQ